MLPQFEEGLGPFVVLIPLIATLICFATASIAYVKGQTPLSVALVVWFAVAYPVSQQDVFLTTPDAWTLPQDIFGFLVYGALSVIPVGIFYVAYNKVESFQRCIVNDIPAWWYVALQVYRLGGGVFLYIYLNGFMQNYTCLQTGILDLFIGVTALPLAYLVKSHGGLEKWGTYVTMWHTVGLYAVSAFALCIANLLGLYQSEPSCAFLGFYPFSLAVLYQVPIAMAIHLLFLTQSKELMAAEQERTTVESQYTNLD